MAVHAITNQLVHAQRWIDLGDRTRIAGAALREVHSILHQSSDLRRLGLDNVLIGSYAREVSIVPGKDVDVFGHLLNWSTGNTYPSLGYWALENSLAICAQQGRLSPCDGNAVTFRG